MWFFADIYAMNVGVILLFVSDIFCIVSIDLMHDTDSNIFHAIESYLYFFFFALISVTICLNVNFAWDFPDYVSSVFPGTTLFMSLVE